MRRRICALERGGLQEDLSPDAGGAELTPVIVTGGTGTNHTADIYADGLDVAATESGATLKILYIAATESVTVGERLGAWRQKWSGAEEWTADFPRWAFVST